MRLGIYCRKSKLKDGNNLSIRDQKEKGIAIAKKLNIPYEFYIDEDLSGTLEKVEDRPNFERLLNDIMSGKITSVFAYDQSRLERNIHIRYILNQIFKENNIDYYTEIEGKVDIYNPHQEFHGDIVSVINKYFVTMTKIKVKSAMQTRVKEGKAHSILPYGYTKDSEGRLVINEEEAKVVREIYDLSLKGMGTRSIAQHLNDNCIPTKCGGKLPLQFPLPASHYPDLSHRKNRIRIRHFLRKTLSLHLQKPGQEIFHT